MSLPSVVFMGSPHFATPSLAALINENVEIRGVFTQPPKPSGRGHRTVHTPIYALAKTHNLPVFTPNTWKEESVALLQKLNPDLVIVVAYGFLLKAAVLRTPPLGCINIHASLLPKWRGAAPIHHALLAGDTHTGITLMYMDIGMDTGDMIAHRAIPIAPHATTPIVLDQLAHLGATLLTENLPALLSGKAPRTPQPLSGVTYAPKIFAKDFAIDWNKPAAYIERQIRAYYPKTFFIHGEQKFRITHASVVTKTDPTESAQRLILKCKDGYLEVHEIAPPNKAPMSTRAFLNGYGGGFIA